MGARVSTVTHLHAYNLLAVLLGSNNNNNSTNNTTNNNRNRSNRLETSPSKSGTSPSRRRLDQSHIPEWRQAVVVVSPPTGRGSLNIMKNGSATSPLSPTSSPTRTDHFAQDFFDSIMATEQKEAVDGSRQEIEIQSVLNAFEKFICFKSMIVSKRMLVIIPFIIANDITKYIDSE